MDIKSPETQILIENNQSHLKDKIFKDFKKKYLFITLFIILIFALVSYVYLQYRNYKTESQKKSAIISESKQVIETKSRMKLLKNNKYFFMGRVQSIENNIIMVKGEETISFLTDSNTTYHQLSWISSENADEKNAPKVKINFSDITKGDFVAVNSNKIENSYIATDIAVYKD